jgi:hypothetical protein
MGQKLEDMNPDAIAEMCQLVKNNSIEGSKASKVDVIYTEFENLRKTSTMDIGTVSFHDQKAVIKIKNVERDRDIVKNIEKSKTEAYPDLEQMRKDRDLEEKNRRRKEAKDRELKEKEEKKHKQDEADLLSYKTFMNNKNLKTSNKSQGDGSIESCKKMEDDFW